MNLFKATAVMVAMTSCGSQVLSQASRLEEETYLAAAVAPDLIQYSLFEVASREHIEIIPDAGVELRITRGQPKVNNGIRAELSIDYPFVENDTIRYEWQLWVPADFQPDPQNRWWVFADWHDQPNRTLGETWDAFPSHSAPLIVGYGHVEGGQVVGGFSVPNSSDVLTITYGTDYRPLGMFAFNREETTTIRLDVTWSQTERGKMKAWVNGVERVSATGPNMLNAFQHYFKAGMYRNPEIDTANRVRLSNVKITKL